MFGVKLYLHLFLTYELDLGEWSASHYGCLLPGVPGSHSTGLCVGLRPRLEGLGYFYSLSFFINYLN